MTPLLRLVRFQYGHVEGEATLGYIALEAPELLPCVYTTIEDAWLGNAVGKSCIPDGLYRCCRGRFNAGGYPAFELQDVPGRTLIKMHAARRDENVTGCISVALRFGVTDGEIGFPEFKAGFQAWMEAMTGIDAFFLSVGPAVAGMPGAKLERGMHGYVED